MTQIVRLRLRFDRAFRDDDNTRVGTLEDGEAMLLYDNERIATVQGAQYAFRKAKRLKDDQEGWFAVMRLQDGQEFSAWDVLCDVETNGVAGLRDDQAFFGIEALLTAESGELKRVRGLLEQLTGIVRDVLEMREAQERDA